MRILQCSTKGCSLGKKFSAFIAQVEIEGKWLSIEEHYQTAKLFNGNRLDKKTAKGKKPDGVAIFGKEYPPTGLTSYYYFLWFVYYVQNKDLVEQAKLYDEYNDMFKGKSLNCQADTLRMWIRNREEYMELINPIINILKEGHYSIAKPITQGT